MEIIGFADEVPLVYEVLTGLILQVYKHRPEEAKPRRISFQPRNVGLRQREAVDIWGAACGRAQLDFKPTRFHAGQSKGLSDAWHSKNKQRDHCNSRAGRKSSHRPCVVCVRVPPGDSLDRRGHQEACKTANQQRRSVAQRYPVDEGPIAERKSLLKRLPGQPSERSRNDQNCSKKQDAGEGGDVR